MEIRHEICVETCFLAARVVHILLAHVVAGKLCLEAAHTEIEGIVERERRRECYRRIATVDGDGIGPFVLIEILRKILDTVAGECGVGAPVEPVDGLVLSSIPIR